MAEHDWRPRDAAERAHEGERASWYQRTHGERTPSEADKDALFVSEEARAFDRGVVERYDDARKSWEGQEKHDRTAPDVPQSHDDPWGKD